MILRYCSPRKIMQCLINLNGWIDDRIFTEIWQIYVHSQLYLPSSLDLSRASFILFGHLNLQVWFVRFSDFFLLLFTNTPDAIFCLAISNTEHNCILWKKFVPIFASLYTVYILINLCACTKIVGFFVLFCFLLLRKLTWGCACLNILRQRSNGVWDSVLYVSYLEEPSCHGCPWWHAVWAGWFCVLLPFSGNLVWWPIAWALFSSRAGIKSSSAT